MIDHDPSEKIILTFQKDFGKIKKGDVLTYNATGFNPKNWGATLELIGGEVIATDQEGRPAFVTHTYGEGRTFLCAYPLESISAVTPAGFEGKEDTWRLYSALADKANIQPLFRTDHPVVEVSSLIGEKKGVIVLANHSRERIKTRLTSDQKVATMARLLPDERKELQSFGQPWEVEVDAWDGVILEWTLE